jgi:Family of unknown function (DUF6152)
MNSTSAVADLTVGVLMAFSPAFAHHSETGFDSNRRVTLTGTVQAFEWMNPNRITHEEDVP